MSEEVRINHAAVILPITPDRRILLQRKDNGYPWNPGMWCFFGGKIEANELASGEDTIYREVKEELGLALERSAVSYFGAHPYFDVAPVSGKRREGNLHAYIAQFDGDVSRLRLKEGAGFSLWDERDVWSLHMVPHNKDLTLKVYRSFPR